MASSPRWKAISISRVPSSWSSADPDPLTSALIKALEGEEHDSLAVLEIQGGVHDPEGQLTPATPLNADEGGLHEIKVVSIPRVRPHNPPPADHLTVCKAAHLVASRSRGRQTRL